MLSRRLRLPLAFAAVAIAGSGAFVVAHRGSADPETVSETLTGTPTPAPLSGSAAPAPGTAVSVAPKLGPATYVTSAPPKPSASATQRIDVHVDCRNGNDGNNGTQAKPLRSVDAATSRSIDAGTVIGLARGCTWNTLIDLRGDGTKSRPIKLTAYGSGALPVIDGGKTDREGVITLSGSYQIVENIRVTDALKNGIVIMGSNSGVQSSTVDNAGVGVQFRGRGGWAQRVTVRDLSMVRDTPGGDDDYGAVGFLVEAHDVEIGYSSCTNCRAPSHDYGHDGGFVEVWNYGDNLDVHHSTGNNTQGVLEIGSDSGDSSAHNIRLRNNKFSNTHGGMVLHTGGNFAIGDAQIAWTGNTISSTGSSDPPILDGDLSKVTFDGNTVSTASFVAHSTPASHRCNTITLRGGAELGYQRHSTERVNNGKASC
ncbi:alanine and proline-rich secreted protein Apa [Actinoplanes bogorensis]|uniref:Alanine and proline-rich secreted protein Apa n=1 Tax=Paractinoplanes bogorensis TaxID=1610840 RepID=A0ABS5YSC0_9ACTN|nr:alanine and proline-rich secreted protein Apa [Actinoplanes bogorensis]MBU2666352.1 alanine and proline-rich secreted protein Apa [Actinoplanes bogorensis]